MSAAAPRGTAVAFFPDGKRVLAGSTAGYFDVLSVPDGKLLDRIETGQKSVNGLAISNDGTRIATANGDGTVSVWSAADFSKQATLTGHSKFVMAVAFSPDGARIASGGGDMTVRLWDATTGAPIAESSGHSNRVNAVAFSADGKLIASASEDASVRIWDGLSGAEVAVLKPPDTNTGLRKVAFSPDSSRVAGGNIFDTFVWNVSAKSLAYKTSGALFAIMYLPDGKRLALGRDVMTLADAATGKILASYGQALEQIGGNPAATAVSSDGKRFAVLPDRGTIYIASFAELDAIPDTEACEYEDLRDPMCLGEPCEVAKVASDGSCISVTNTTPRRVHVTAKLRCGSDAVLYLDPGQSEKLSYGNDCVRTRGDLIAIDMAYAKGGEGRSSGATVTSTLPQCAWQVSDKRGPRHEARLLLPPANESETASATGSLLVEYDAFRAAQNPAEGRRVLLRVRQSSAGRAGMERAASIVIKVDGKVAKQYEISGDDERSIGDAFPGGLNGLAAAKSVEVIFKADGEDLSLISCQPQDTVAALGRLGGGRPAP